MTSFIVDLGGMEARITATADLPASEQGEALVALYQATGRSEMAAFVALLIGEVVHLRSLQRPRRRPSPVPALSASA